MFEEEVETSFIRQANVPIRGREWGLLHFLSIACLLVSLATAAGAIFRIIVVCKGFMPVHNEVQIF